VVSKIEHGPAARTTIAYRRRRAPPSPAARSILAITGLGRPSPPMIGH
jgi:hypothetical protein